MKFVRICILLTGFLAITFPAHAQKKKHSEPRIPILVLDIDGRDIQVTKKFRLYWDIDEDDYAEAIKWPGPGDAVLVHDKNGNGLLDSQSELFGSLKLTAFDALRALDSNGDKIIDSKDKEWGALGLLRNSPQGDKPFNRKIESLKQFKVVSIALPADTNSLQSEFTLRTSGGNIKFFIIKAVALRYSNTNTMYNKPFQPYVDAWVLPDLRGYGIIPDLSIAMSLDKDGRDSLYERVKALSDQNIEQLFNPERDIQHDVENMLFRYAGAEKIDPESRGPHMDARRLVFLERFLGDKFVQIGATSNTDPLYWAATALRDAYRILFSNMYAGFMVQTSARELFIGTAYYNLQRDKAEDIRGLNMTTLARIGDIIDTTPDIAKRERAWIAVARLIEHTAKLQKLPPKDLTQLNRRMEISLGRKQPIQDIYRHLQIGDNENASLRDYAPHILPDRYYKLTHKHLTPAGKTMMNAAALLFILCILYYIFYAAWMGRKRRHL